jgi:hypothetical protein
MKEETKLLAVVGVLPVIADFLEDLVDSGRFKRDAKVHVSNLIAHIRRLDTKIMTGADSDVVEQQIDVQRAFRQWLLKSEEHDRQADSTRAD